MAAVSPSFYAQGVDPPQDIDPDRPQGQGARRVKVNGHGLSRSTHATSSTAPKSKRNQYVIHRSSGPRFFVIIGERT